MTKKRAAVLVFCLFLLLLLLPFGRQRPEPVVVVQPIAAPPPAVELCVQEPGELPRAPAPVDVRLADPGDDTGGPMVTLNVRGTLVIESVRDDGTPEPSPILELMNRPPSWQLEPLAHRATDTLPRRCTGR